MTEACKHCGWKPPGGNYVHSRDACDDMREDTLLRLAKAVKAWSEFLPPKKYSRVEQGMIDAFEALPEGLK